MRAWKEYTPSVVGVLARPPAAGQARGEATRGRGVVQSLKAAQELEEKAMKKRPREEDSRA
jgi:hypothetical protein